MAQRPPLLMLKDYLELDSDSESGGGSSGFHRAPLPSDSTVRCLLEAELCHGGSEGAAGRRQLLRGARSKNAALVKLSTVINAVKLSSFSSSSSSSSGSGHSGSFPRKMTRGSFWKSKRVRHQEETEEVRVRDIVRLRPPSEDAEEGRSFGFPPPIVGNCGSWSDTASSASDFLPSTVSNSEYLDGIAAFDVSDESKKGFSPPSTPKAVEAVAGSHRPPPKEAEAKGMVSPDQCHLEEEEDKEQLSPVSVMDFPYEEEEEDDDDEEEEEEDVVDDSEEETSIDSSSFNQSLANIERTKLQLLQKIRRFESLAELDAVDLETRFEDLLGSGDDHETAPDAEWDGDDGVTSRSPPETRARGLVEELRRGIFHRGPPLRCFEKLLFDFFVQGLRCLDDDGDVVDLGRPARWKGPEALSAQREESMLKAARDWMRGDVDVGQQRQAAIMEGGNGRGRSHGDEVEELGADLEGFVFGLLVDEMVLHLTSS